MERIDGPLRRNEQPSEQEMTEVLQLETNKDVRNRLHTFLSTIYMMIHNANKRNSMIAKNMLNRPGNHVLVIGEAHTKDLVNKLVAECKERVQKKTESSKKIKKANFKQ